MKNLRIEFDKHKKNGKKMINGNLHYHGELFLNGKLEDCFYAPTHWWSKDDYEEQWYNAFKYFENHNKTCFVSSISDPRRSPWLEFYAIYRVKEDIIIHPYGFFGDNYKRRIGISAYTPITCFNFIPALRRKR